MTNTINKMDKRKCEFCGRIFEPRRRWQKFCSSICRVSAWHASRVRPEELSELKVRLDRLEKKLQEIENIGG